MSTYIFAEAATGFYRSNRIGGCIEIIADGRVSFWGEENELDQVQAMLELLGLGEVDEFGKTRAVVRFNKNLSFGYRPGVDMTVMAGDTSVVIRLAGEGEK